MIGMLVAVAAGAVVGDVDVLGGVAFGEGLREGGQHLLGQFNIDDFAAFAAVKVGVLGQIWAVARGLPLKIDLADELRFDERFQAVVDRREGNSRHPTTGAGKNLIRGGVIPLFKQERIDVLALLGRTLPAET